MMVFTSAGLAFLLVAFAAMLALSFVAARSSADARTGAVPAIAMVGLLGAGCLLCRAQGQDPEAFLGALLGDALGVVLGSVAILVGILAALVSTIDRRRYDAIALIILVTSGTLMVSLAADLLTLFIGIEIVSVGAYVLAGSRQDDARSQEAAMKYFVYGAFVSGLILMGIALLYGEVGLVAGRGSFQIAELSHTVGEHGLSSLGFVGLVLLVVGLCFKVAAAPFHMWAPDVYEGTPASVSGFLAVGVKVAGYAALMRIVPSFASPDLLTLVGLLAGLSMVLGNVMALVQRRVKRLLAYSSVAHAGYILLGVIGYAQGVEGSLWAVAVYLLAYACMTLGAFAVVARFERTHGIVTLDSLAGLGLKHAPIGFLMAVFMFSLAGIPPTAGFIGKFYIFKVAVDGGFVALAILGAVSSVIGAYYYLNVLVAMFMRKSRADSDVEPVTRWAQSGLYLAAAVLLAVGVMPTLAEKLIPKYGAEQPSPVANALPTDR